MQIEKKKMRQKGKNQTEVELCTFSRGNFTERILIIILVSFESGANAKYSPLAHNNSKILSKGADLSLFPTSTSISFLIYLHGTRYSEEHWWYIHIFLLSALKAYHIWSSIVLTSALQLPIMLLRSCQFIQQGSTL